MVVLAEGYLGEKLATDDYVVDIRDEGPIVYKIVNVLPHVIGIRGWDGQIHYRPSRWFKNIIPGERGIKETKCGKFYIFQTYDSFRQVEKWYHTYGYTTEKKINHNGHPYELWITEEGSPYSSIYHF